MKVFVVCLATLAFASAMPAGPGSSIYNAVMGVPRNFLGTMNETPFAMPAQLATTAIDAGSTMAEQFDNVVGNMPGATILTSFLTPFTNMASGMANAASGLTQQATSGLNGLNPSGMFGRTMGAGQQMGQSALGGLNSAGQAVMNRLSSAAGMGQNAMSGLTNGLGGAAGFGQQLGQRAMNGLGSVAGFGQQLGQRAMGGLGDAATTGQNMFGNLANTAGLDTATGIGQNALRTITDGLGGAANTGQNMASNLANTASNLATGAI